MVWPYLEDTSHILLTLHLLLQTHEHFLPLSRGLVTQEVVKLYGVLRAPVGLLQQGFQPQNAVHQALNVQVGVVITLNLLFLVTAKPVIVRGDDLDEDD